ncbi:MAG: dickkopf-related protein [Vicinamibacterales bacterium]
MKKVFFLVLTCTALFSAQAHADLCDSVTDVVRPVVPGIENDLNFYEELFPDVTYQGDRRWNEILLQCNRQRDSKGNEVLKATGTDGGNAEKQILKASGLKPKVIRGHYNFVGLPIGSPLSFKYVYIFEKKDGVWTMIIPYKPSFNELVPNRVDFNFTHARTLYDASQVENPSSTAQVLNLKSGSQPIATTLCSTSTYFPGDEGKYDDKGLHQRDPENKFISLGKIEYKYEKDGDTSSGCRVDKNRDLYWQWDPKRNQAVKVKPQNWILDNFVRTSESYWTIPGVFQLKVLLKGHNEATFPKSTLDLLQDDDHLTTHFATKFLRAHFNQMYKSNVFQVNNFSTMTLDGSYWHEVGHAFGLDDEYGFVDAEEGKKSCRNKRFSTLYATSAYQMCEGGVSDKRTIYHYLAVSRYVTKQSECGDDNDCANAEYCDKGTITLGKNQCVPQKADGQGCTRATQCAGAACNVRCYTPASKNMGASCNINDECRVGTCSGAGWGAIPGKCVCTEDTHCGTGQYCNTGAADIGTNVCKPRLADGKACTKDHQCTTLKCSEWRPQDGQVSGICYTPNSKLGGESCRIDLECKVGKCNSNKVCVCKSDGDCKSGYWCDGGFADLENNACKRKLGKGESCGVGVNIGHRCLSGKCSFGKCK